MFAVYRTIKVIGVRYAAVILRESLVVVSYGEVTQPSSWELLRIFLTKIPVILQLQWETTSQGLERWLKY